MKLVLMSFAVFIITLTINLRISLKLDYCVTSNEGHILLKFFGIPVFSSKFTIAGNFITLTRKRNKVINIKISLKDNSVQFIQDVLHSLQRKIYIQRLDFEAFVALLNAMNVALVSGYLSTISGILMSLVSMRNKDTKYNHHITSAYDQSKLQLVLQTVVYLNLYDLIWSMLTAVYKRRYRLYGQSKYRNNS